MLNHPRGTQRPGLFVRLGKQNDVAIEHDFAPVQIHHHGQFGGEKLLIVLGPAPVDIAVLFNACQGIHRPLRAIEGDHIAVRDQEQRALLAVAAEARNKVEAFGIVAQQFRRNALPVGHLLQVSRDAGLVPGWIRGVQSDQLRQVARRQVGRRFSCLSKRNCRARERDPSQTIHASECSIVGHRRMRTQDRCLT